MNIRQLPSDVIAKIAAGEVIETPAFAVKELLENAIDAKANEIIIHIEDAGLTKIQVQDNGEGMDQQDVEASWKLHTTSKISDDSLFGIQTLGFRGEALSSLASVSKLQIKSRTHNNASGWAIEVHNGKIIKSGPVGIPEGTVVTAEQLFHSFPARKKFLNSNQTEFRRITERVMQFALAYPHISFHLTHNKKTILNLAATTQKERVEEIVGADTFQDFLPLTYEDSFLRVSGFIAKPQRNSSTTAKQFLFVNNRSVHDKLIPSAVKEAFGTMLEPTSFPLFVLFLTIPFEMVDVNVHPRKEHVSFTNSQEIFVQIKQAVSELLGNNNLTFQNLSWKRKGVGLTGSFLGQKLKKQVLQPNSLISPHDNHLAQFHNLYIFVQTQEGILVVDQHAAHERVLFERLKKTVIYEQKKKHTYILEHPFKMHLSQQETMLLSEHAALFTHLGYSFTIQKSSALITAVPFLFKDRDHAAFMQSMLEELGEGKPIREVDTTSEEMLMFLACRAAVKAGDKLTQEQMKQIIKELEQTENNATCPHGRPTKIYVQKDEIDSLFKRN